MDKKIRNIIGSLIGVVILYFVIKHYYKVLPDIVAILKNANILLLVIGISFIALGIGIISFIWQLLFEKFYGIKVSVLRAAAMVFLPNIARYVPGKFWFVFGIVYLAKRWNMKTSHSLTVTVLSQIFFMLSGAIIGTSFLVYKSQGLIVAIFLMVIEVTAGIIFWTKLFHSLAQKNYRIFGKDIEFVKEIKFDIGITLKCLGIGFIMWLLIGWGLMFCIKSSLTDFPLNFWVAIMAIYAVSYIIGYISFFVPAGLGVREGTMSYFLPDVISKVDEGFIVLGTRVWTTLGEILLLAFIIAGLLVKGEIRREHYEEYK